MTRFVKMMSLSFGPVAINPSNVTHVVPSRSQHHPHGSCVIHFNAATADDVDAIAVIGSLDEVLAALSPSLPGVA